MNDMHDVPFPEARDAEVATLRLPPHSIEAEQSVLGGLLLANSAWDRIADVLVVGDFYRADHRVIFEAIARLMQDAKPADVLTVAHAIQDAGQQHRVSDEYLRQLAAATPSAANIRRYAEIIRDRSLRRQLIESATEIADQAYADGDTAEQVAAAQTRMLALTESRMQGREARPLSDALADVMLRLDERSKSPERPAGITTGLTDLDERLLGLLPAKLYVIGARPSMGKSALMLQIALHAAWQGKQVLMFSAEMDDTELAERALSGAARVNSHAMRAGRLAQEDWDSIGRAIGRLNDLPLEIDDRPSPTLQSIGARARSMKRRRGLDLVVVDYLQLVTVAGAKFQTRDQEITSIAEGLKGLAKTLAIPVIALSQLNRKCEDRVNKRPTLGDLREGGGIEQAADAAMFIYRDEVYHEDSPDRGTAEIIVAKLRGGAIGTVRVAWMPHLTRFEDLAHDWQPAARKAKGRRAMEDE